MLWAQKRPMADNGTVKKSQIPDVLGAAGRAEMIANTLLDLQRQLFRLELTQQTNGHSDTDLVPGPTLDGGESITYAQTRQKLQDGLQRLHDEYETELVAVHELLEGQA